MGYVVKSTMLLQPLFAVLKVIVLFSIQVKATGSALSPNDPASYSRPEIIVLKHACITYKVDFDHHILNGSVLLKFEVVEETDEVILDVHNLTIYSVELENCTKLRYKEDGHILNFGSRLVITLPHEFSPTDRVNIRVRFATSPKATGLQWLQPSQTLGKEYPYLFSQCQSIHARSILPCQDTPAVKFTYDAEVTAPEGFTVLMSALNKGKDGRKTKFRQPLPIPSYLLAIAVGMLEHRELGPRSKVWSEKEQIEKSAWEFADTEKYLQAAEKLCGPYQWEQYDLLVLPPSFPYGGMENPCLTFVTPALLAGDRSQVDVIVHEIMHSWSGNLVTNKNFEHFWLNEGFTMFLERKVTASLIEDPVEAKKERDFQSLLGLHELKESIYEQYTPTDPLTHLVPSLEGIHPDDAFSRVPYEKGSLFLRYLEDLVGGPKVFDGFLRSYIKHYQRRSLDTEHFKTYLLNYFKDTCPKKLNRIDWEAWLHAPGMPPVIPAYDTSKTEAVTRVLEKLNDSNAEISHHDVSHFSPHQIIKLLQELIEQPPLSLQRLGILGEKYKVADSQNSEIRYRWLRLCVRSKDESRLQEVFDFVNSHGRLKYLRPLYRDLHAWEEVRQQATDNFLNNENNMMHVLAQSLRKDLNLAEKMVHFQIKVAFKVT